LLTRITRYRAGLFRRDYFAVRAIAQFVHSALRQHVTATSRLGDIGCGEQPLRNEVQELGASYVGIDVVQNSQGNVDILAPITNLPVADSSFDVLLCTEVLEHVSDTQAAFDELARVLVPGGTIIGTTPFAYPLHEEPHDFVRLTAYQIGRCAVESGLEVFRIDALGNEIEVLATVWDNLWGRLGVKRALRVIARAPVNVVCAVTSEAVGNHLPRKSYLINAFVLRKPT
jgi:SAM-dependent methyltransferase